MKVERYTPDTKLAAEIGKRLRKIRTANELSIEEFASRICDHPFDCGRVEHGSECYSESMIKLISYEFGVSVSWIMQGVPDETDPAYCTEDKDGKQIFDSCISIQEAMWDYTTDNGVDMWSNGVERAIDNIHSHIKYICRNVSVEDESLIDNELRDAISLANSDGYTVGWRTAVQLISKLLNLNSLPDTPPTAQSSDKTLTPAFITTVRKVNGRKTNT